MRLRLPPELERLVEAKVESGTYGSARGEWVDGETFMQEMLEGIAARRRHSSA
jgi:hypothetical protein